MKILITESQLLKIVREEKDHIIKWKESESGKDKYICHECGHDNNPKSKMGQPEWLNCKNCGKKSTITVMKNGKKSLPICQHCGTHH
jgi:DNA-directed RNA polymerase subunit RPC12/RpoP